MMNAPDCQPFQMQQSHAHKTRSAGVSFGLHGALQDTDLMTERKNLEMKRGTAPK
jgi:hypothetical protein